MDAERVENGRDQVHPRNALVKGKRKRTINMIDLTLEQHVELLLENFDVPNTRRNVEKKKNVRWLLRNLRIDNKDNPHLKHVSACLKAILTKEQLI